MNTALADVETKVDYIDSGHIWNLLWWHMSQMDYYVINSYILPIHQLITLG